VNVNETRVERWTENELEIQTSSRMSTGQKTQKKGGKDGSARVRATTRTDHRQTGRRTQATLLFRPPFFKLCRAAQNQWLCDLCPMIIVLIERSKVPYCFLLLSLLPCSWIFLSLIRFYSNIFIV
jgi:hypothetical protein